MNSADSPRSPSPDRWSAQPRLGLSVWVPWALVATLALLCLWLSQLYFMTHAEYAVLRDQHRLTQLELRDARQHAEAERILAQRELADLRRQLAER